MGHKESYTMTTLCQKSFDIARHDNSARQQPLSCEIHHLAEIVCVVCWVDVIAAKLLSSVDSVFRKTLKPLVVLGFAYPQSQSGIVTQGLVCFCGTWIAFRKRTLSLANELSEGFCTAIGGAIRRKALKKSGLLRRRRDSNP